MIVLDTHALLWWALDPDRLSSTAAARLKEMEQRGGYASTISLWELGVKVKRVKLQLPLTVDEFARRIEQGGVVELLPVDTATWSKSLSLRWDHRDPADRVIVATAVQRRLPLLTVDQAIRSWRGVDSVW